MSRVALAATFLGGWWAAAGVLRLSDVIHWHPEWQLWAVIVAPTSVEVFGLVWGIAWSVDWPNQEVS